MVSGSGAVTATVQIEVGGGDHWELFDTLYLSGTDRDSDGTSLLVPWGHVRAQVVAISGTLAAVDVEAFV